MRSIVVPVPDGVAARVADIARAEFRTPKAQALVLLMEALAQRGQSVDLKSAERAGLKRS